MSEAVWIAIIGAGIPAIVTAIGASWKIALEQGRADEYRRNAESTIAQKNTELEETRTGARDTIRRLETSLGECRRNCEALRRQLEANP